MVAFDKSIVETSLYMYVFPFVDFIDLYISKIITKEGKKRFNFRLHFTYMLRLNVLLIFTKQRWIIHLNFLINIMCFLNINMNVNRNGPPCKRPLFHPHIFKRPSFVNHSALAGFSLFESF